jgi:hypothetical protein
VGKELRGLLYLNLSIVNTQTCEKNEEEEEENVYVKDEFFTGLHSI